MNTTCTPALRDVSERHARDPVLVRALTALLAAGALLAQALLPVAASAQQARVGPQGIAAGDRIAGPAFATRSPVMARNGAAATAHPLATRVAIDILQAGGSAVDAAIAANAALGVLEPTGNGIGGDLFALVYDPRTRQVYGFNGSGRAPAGMSLDDRVRRERSVMGAAGVRPSFGAVTVTVPGTVDGWYQLHGRFGALPMRRLLAPAIGYARDGAPVAPVIAHYWSRNLARLSQRAASGEVEEFDNARATYFRDGRAPAAGEIFANPDLARTLETVAREGRDAFYRGRLARTMDAYFQRIGGPLRLADLAVHRGEWVEPVSTPYRDTVVWQIPPNSQGVTTLQILGILERFDMAGAGLLTSQSLHLQIEAKRLAFADRARFFADPAFAPAPVAGLLSPAYLDARAALIRPDAILAEAMPGDPAALATGDTTFLVTADRSGMMVALIQSNYRGMGSGLVPDGLGFMFQNRGEAFSLDPAHANVYAPGKRPFHTIIPGMVTRGGAGYIAFGVMGGAMQPQGQAQVLVNMIDHGLDPQAAGDAPRWRHEGGCEPEGDCTPGTGEVLLESGMPTATREGLAAIGWTLRAGDGGFGGYQAILRDPVTGVYSAGSESRTDGAALGY
jgi:gamma-glutamyltranspeptidase / glutathione hydrolase